MVWARALSWLHGSGMGIPSWKFLLNPSAAAAAVAKGSFQLPLPLSLLKGAVAVVGLPLLVLLVVAAAGRDASSVWVALLEFTVIVLGGPASKSIASGDLFPGCW